MHSNRPCFCTYIIIQHHTNTKTSFALVSIYLLERKPHFKCSSKHSSKCRPSGSERDRKREITNHKFHYCYMLWMGHRNDLTDKQYLWQRWLTMAQNEILHWLLIRSLWRQFLQSTQHVCFRGFFSLKSRWLKSWPFIIQHLEAAVYWQSTQKESKSLFRTTIMLGFKYVFWMEAINNSSC